MQLIEAPRLTKLVIDSSVVIKWFVPEPNSVRARAILAQYQHGQVALLAPDIITAEVANVLWRKHSTQRLSPADGQVILDTFRSLRLTTFPVADLLDVAYAQSIRLRQSVFDMLYVALAQRERCAYLTADEELVTAISASVTDVFALSTFR
jgi:predicted nucleic acid-binding protein